MCTLQQWKDAPYNIEIHSSGGHYNIVCGSICYTDAMCNASYMKAHLDSCQEQCSYCLETLAISPCVVLYLYRRTRVSSDGFSLFHYIETELQHAACSAYYSSTSRIGLEQVITASASGTISICIFIKIVKNTKEDSHVNASQLDN